MGRLAIWKLVVIFLTSAILGDAINYLVSSSVSTKLSSQLGLEA